MASKHLSSWTLLCSAGVGVILPSVVYGATPDTSERIRRLNEKLSHQALILQEQQVRLSTQIDTIKAELRSIQTERAELVSLTGTKNATISHPTVVSQVPNPVSPTQHTLSAAKAVPEGANVSRQAEQAQINRQEREAEVNKKERANLVLQTNSSLSQSGGVLTPKGSLVIEPSLQYFYYNTNQINVNGFTIIPGITFGNLNINKVNENLSTEEITFRYGLTNRSDIYVQIPFDAGYNTTITSPVLVGQNVGPIAVSAHAFNLGDIQFGGSYQLNKGSDSVPTFVANLNFKTITGTSPFGVPIFTTNSPEGIYLQGVDRQLPTGTGFYQLQPSVTVLYPISPVILFANLKYIYNFSKTVSIQSASGGTATPEELQPGNGVGLSFGMGFSLNDRTSFSIGYEEDQYFNQKENGTSIKGTAYDVGSFNFGLGFQVTHSISADIGVGIGVGPNAPAAQIVVRLPIRMNIF